MRDHPAAAAASRSRVSRRTFLLASGAGLVTACRDTLDDAPGSLRLATGPQGGVYREIGAALASVLDRRLPSTKVRALPTDASVENLSLLAEGRTDLGFAQLDATMAGLADGVPHEATAVARLFDSWLHLVVHADGPIRDVRDLDGRVVAIGAPRSGTQFTVRRLLELLPDVRPRTVHLPQDEEAAAFRAGRVDAFFTMTGVPTPAVSTLASTMPIRLVPLPGFADELNRHHGPGYAAYRSATVASSAYPGIPATETVTVANLLLVRPELAVDVVEVVAATLFAERERIARGHPEARSINVRTGIATGPVPLHPGAVRYFRAHKR